MTTINNVPYLVQLGDGSRTPINYHPYLVTVEGGVGTSDYNELSNLPKLEGVTIKGEQQLTDFGAASVDFVNSSIATNTAHYISNNGQPFNSLVDLKAYSGPVTNNDYAFVVGTDEAGNTTYTRYKYSSADFDWAKEYVLNNSSFTAAQWAAIQSGITAALVGKLTGLANIKLIGDNLTLDDDGKLTAVSIEIVQTTGQATNKVMSQKAVTDSLAANQTEIDNIKVQMNKYFEGDDDIIIEPIELG